VIRIVLERLFLEPPAPGGSVAPVVDLESSGRSDTLIIVLVVGVLVLAATLGWALTHRKD
jgi:hypothetical protein